MGREWVGLNEGLKKAYESAPARAFGPCGPCILRFSSDWVRDRVRYGHICLDCFSSLRTINMYLMLFVKRRTSSRFATTTLGALPPLILGFRPSKRHAALIASCDQGSVVLAFTLALLVLKRFWWRVMLVILMFVAWLLVDSSCFHRLSSTNIMLSLCNHVSISC